MKSIPRVSTRTRQNWWLGTFLLFSGIIASLSGVYFLFFVIGGYQGGRNPLYGVTFLMSRQSWDMWHTWTGSLMIMIAVIHLILHWDWVRKVVRRGFKTLMTGHPKFNRQARLNILINIVIGLSFLVTAISGVYFMFFPGGPDRFDPGLLFSRITWDMLHTWGGIIFVLAAVAHFYIHWRWGVKVSRNIFNSLFKQKFLSGKKFLVK